MYAQTALEAQPWKSAVAQSTSCSKHKENPLRGVCKLEPAPGRTPAPGSARRYSTRLSPSIVLLLQRQLDALGRTCMRLRVATFRVILSPAAGRGSVCLRRCDTGWGRVPAGCSVQSGGDWTGHYNNGKSPNSACEMLYTLVCLMPGPRFTGVGIRHRYAPCRLRHFVGPEILFVMVAKPRLDQVL